MVNILNKVCFTMRYSCRRRERNITIELLWRLLNSKPGFHSTILPLVLLGLFRKTSKRLSKPLRISLALLREMSRELLILLHLIHWRVSKILFSLIWIVSLVGWHHRHTLELWKLTLHLLNIRKVPLLEILKTSLHLSHLRVLKVSLHLIHLRILKISLHLSHLRIHLHLRHSLVQRKILTKLGMCTKGRARATRSCVGAHPLPLHRLSLVHSYS